MFRYRCPQCGQLLQALEMRAGKTTVCSQCSRPLTIPADRAQWLDEHGDPLPAVDPASGVALSNMPSSNIFSADTLRRNAQLPSFNPLDELDIHAPIVLGDDDPDAVNLTPATLVPPPPPPQPLAPRKVYEAQPPAKLPPASPAPAPRSETADRGPTREIAA